MSSETYNDRALSASSKDALPKPQIEIIVDGTSVFKPGMKTYFVDDYGEGSKHEVHAHVEGSVCTCDTVVSTHLVCTCESVSQCTCLAYSPGSPCPAYSGGVPTTPSIPNGTGGTVCTCQAVSCGSPCACVPVYV